MFNRNQWRQCLEQVVLPPDETTEDLAEVVAAILRNDWREISHQQLRDQVNNAKRYWGFDEAWIATFIREHARLVREGEPGDSASFIDWLQAGASMPQAAVQAA